MTHIFGGTENTFDSRESLGTVIDKFINALPRGAFKPRHIDTVALIGTSVVGSNNNAALGSAGSGTETLIITSTLQSRHPFDKMFAIHQTAWYQGNGTSGTGLVRDSAFTGTQTHWATEEYLDWEAASERNLVARSVIRNRHTALGTISFRGQWKFIQVPGGGTT